MSSRFTSGTSNDAYYVKTVSSLSSLFLALVLYPEVQKRAQAELDTVITRDRLPTFDDRPRLPYIDAMCRELQRWQMVTPLGKGLVLNAPIRGAEENCL
jgi:cytochrome P450